MTRRLLAAWAAIVLGVVYLTVAGGGGFFGLYVPAFRVLSVAVALVALAIWLGWSVRHPEWRPRSNLLPAIVVSLAALVVTTITAEQPRLAFDYLAYSALLAGLYLLLVQLLGHPVLGPRITSLGIVIGFGLAAIYDGAVFIHWVDFWSTIGRFSTPPLRPDFEGLSYGNPSTVATVVILLWLVAFARIGIGARRAAILTGGLLVLIASVVFLSGSRGAWAGLAIATPIVAVAWLLDPAHRGQLMSVTSRPAVRRAGVLALFAVLVVAVAFGPALIGRLSEPAGDTRSAFYAAALRMFAAHPVFGMGPGSWVVNRIAFTTPPELDYYIPHAHNIWLQTLAELGVVGAIAGLVVALYVGRLLLRGARSSDETHRRLAWASFFAIVYLGAHQLFDFFVNMPAIGFCLALLIAPLDAAFLPHLQPATRAEQGRVAPARGLAVAAALALATLLSTAWLAWSESAAAAQTAAAQAGDAGQWVDATRLADAALSADPDFPPNMWMAGLAAAHVGDRTRARDLLLQSARSDDFPTAWLDVAELDFQLGDVTATRADLSRALRLGYQQPQLALGASGLYSQLGDEPAAATALSQALVAAPGLASDPYFDEPSRTPLFNAALDLALRDAAPTIGYQIALEAGRIDRARAIVAQLDEGSESPINLEIEAWAGNQGAFDKLHALALGNPLNYDLIARCRRVAARSRDSNWIGSGPWRCDGVGTPPALTVVRVAPAPTERVALPGPNSSWHLQYAYRRMSPYDELVPGLPHLTVVFV